MININIRKLAVTSTLLVIVQESKLSLCGRHCVILYSPFFIWSSSVPSKLLDRSHFKKECFFMSDFFLIFSQASETHLVVKIRGLSAGTYLLTSLTLTFRDGPLCWGVGGGRGEGAYLQNFPVFFYLCHCW